MLEKKDISIVVPVFNSKNSLQELASRIEHTIKQMDVNYEIIFVDDFSSDSSWEVLKDLQKKHSHTTIIRLSKNFGQHNATLCGIRESIGETIITLDDDLEHPPEFIPSLYANFKGELYDVLYAVAKKRKKNKLRALLGFFWYQGSKSIGKGIGRASSFRLLKKEIAVCLTQHQEPFIFIESIIYWYTKNISYEEIEFEKRKHGESNYSLLNLFELNHDVGMHYDTHILKLMRNFGIIVFFGSFFLIMYYALQKIYGNPLPGYTSIIITLLFSTGSVLWGMGYLGSYIGKMFRILNREPQYQISKKIKVTPETLDKNI
ncbi:MAG: glycosyltransferase family 2 protein [Flavobacteriales bacterium]|nr:glycosyltransferase family 2 protein [Flavobacteriales bacterium]